jgi:hypothetical protein
MFEYQQYQEAAVFYEDTEFDEEQEAEVEDN